MESLPKQKTGVEGFDEILHGGLPKGRVTVVHGHHGTGKTFLGLEILQNHAKAGKPALFVSFEEDRKAVIQNAGSIGWDLEELEKTGLLKIISLDLSPLTIFSGEFNIEGTLAIMRDQAAAINAEIFMLDAIDWLIDLFESRNEQIRNLQSIYRMLGELNLTTICSVKAQFLEKTLLDYMADCVISLDQRVEAQLTIRRMRVTKYRGTDYLSNEHPFIITDKGIRILPISAFSLNFTPGTERVSSGVKQLDRMLSGGFWKGSSVLIAGGSGSGKTTLASTFAVQACRRGEKVIIISFEESVPSLVHSMNSAGLDLQKYLDEGLLRVRANLPESVGPDQQLMDIIDAIKAHDPSHVIVDAVTGVERMGSPLAGFDFQVRLLYILKDLGITAILTFQGKKESIREEMMKMEIASVAECVLALQQNWSDETFSRSLAVVKFRGSNHAGGCYPFAITNNGLEISGIKEEDEN